MKNHMKIPPLKVFLLALFVLLLTEPAPSFGAGFKVVKVYSGDKIKVTRGDKSSFLVKLAGIQAPVICRSNNIFSQPFSLESKQYLEGLILNKQIQINSFQTKGYNIIVGEVFLGKKNINLEMLKAGLAQTYSSQSAGSMNFDLYKQVEYEARVKKLGIWSSPDTHESPSQWAKRQGARAECSMILLGILEGRGKITK